MRKFVRKLFITMKTIGYITNSFGLVNTKLESFVLLAFPRSYRACIIPTVEKLKL